MLNNTYIHIPGIGAATEHAIWKRGIKNWEDFLSSHSIVKTARKKKRMLLSWVEESIEQLSCANHVFFARRLRQCHHWRAYRHFREETAYVDIETTGLSPGYADITIIGIYNGKETKTFVKGFNLEDANAELAGYKQLITFNGARFDLPFIEQEFPGFFNHLHIDLMYPLKKIGYCGGLKNVELSLGIKRSEETANLNGFDAVRLWRRYERGDDEALELLIRYNREDVENLEKIMQIVHPELMEREMCLHKSSITQARTEA